MIHVNDDRVTSDETEHRAEPVDGGWRLSWLPQRVVTRDQAVAGMKLADWVGLGVVVPGDDLWPYVEGWASELGVDAEEAAERVSRPVDERGHQAADQAAQDHQADDQADGQDHQADEDSDDL